ncbi:hypothetical protein NPX13_g8146 [Xylaria arbuscula]|uniref:Translation initiation factor IF-2, mitochondrial n=1 Tax=Xylaria arbuscula TaxID=114810 RepID=A0A9W8N9A7_9PEZI|nr:hypothetical protein NPX13_g8146 [Xylaria arbuscula]
MLRGRLGKRDISICAFCRHRISLLRAPAQPYSRLFSVTTPCRNEASSTSAPTAPIRPKFVFKKRQENVLDPHEAAARNSLLLRKQKTELGDNVAPTGLPPATSPLPQHDPRRAQQLEKRAPIQTFLKYEALPKRHGDTSKLQRAPRVLPGISLSRTDLGSTTPIRFEPGNSSVANRASAVGEGFFRRTGHRPDAPLRKVPAPQPPARQQPNIGQTTDSSDFVSSSLSSLVGAAGFWNGNAAEASTAKTLPSRSVQDKQANLTDGPAPQNISNTISPSGGFAELDAAGALDAETKASIKSGSQSTSLGQEWTQLARKSPRRTNLDNDSWNAIQPEISKAQPEHSDSPAIRSNDTAADSSAFKGFDNSISKTPQHQGYHDRDRDRRWDTFERDRKPDKRRGGKRSQRSSRFEDDEDGGDPYDRYQERARQKELRKAEREAQRTEPIPIILPELISITAFANALKIRPDDFLVQLGELGFEGVSLDSLMAGETAALVAQEYGYEPTIDAGDSEDLKPRPPPADPSLLPSRPPVVTIMGHVDHGKTTILDYLRKSSVAAQEHGGITQHIGAFSVKLSSGKPITFLDTPGHAAFLTMRQRGANVTDIVVLVVAADDSVKPQTLEALKHARAAKVPIIVAINKIDKDGARIDAVKHDLATAGVEIEDFGGDVQVVCVSGKTGQGMDDLEENILTLSEILDHRAEPDGAAEGWVLESSLKPTGKVATVLVKRGTLRPGDYIAAGVTWAKIRQLRNEAGVDVTEAPPGDQVIQSPNEDKAKKAVTYREGVRAREKDAAEYEAINEARKALEEKRASEKDKEKATTDRGTGVQEVLPDEEDGTKMVNFVVKGDVHGSVEAVCAVIQGLGNHEVRPRVLRSATGPITEFDVEHAATSKSVLVNFATTTPGHVQRMAEEQGVRILDHTVIYHLVDDVTANLSEYLAPEVTTRVLGEAEVLQIFPINLRGRVYKNIAGCRVRNGAVGKNNLYRVVRNGEVVFDGKLETLKHVKKDVLEMRKGTECGMGFEEFQDLQVGDQIRAYEEVRTARTL